jgi:hypothetical protein
MFIVDCSNFSEYLETFLTSNRHTIIGFNFDSETTWNKNMKYCNQNRCNVNIRLGLV